MVTYRLTAYVCISDATPVSDEHLIGAWSLLRYYLNGVGEKEM